VAAVGGLITVTLMALVVAYVRATVEATFSGSDVVIPKAIVVYDWNYWRVWAPFVSAHCSPPASPSSALLSSRN